MAEFQLKNIYNFTFFDTFSNQFKSVHHDFPKEQFIELIFDNEWKNRALKQRVRHITLCLGKVLPSEYHLAIDILKRVGENLDNKFEYMFFPDFVEVYGLEEFDISTDALRLFTPLCSSEFAVRPFIVKYPIKMMTLMQEWAKDDNHHVRRLASEGCRPRLPWGMALQKFKKNPAELLPILEMLKDDDSEYVRRSVANNLNDISKDHPAFVLEIGERWYGANTNRNKLVKHALRTLLKKGNTQAMQLFGFANPEKVTISKLMMQPQKINIGDTGLFTFELVHSENKPMKLRLEYAVYYMKSNGKQTRKVFQLTEKEFTNQQTFSFEKKQHFKNLTTRKHYSGSHRLVLVVNGVDKAEVTFELM